MYDCTHFAKYGSVNCLSHLCEHFPHLIRKTTMVEHVCIGLLTVINYV